MKNIVTEISVANVLLLVWIFTINQVNAQEQKKDPLKTKMSIFIKSESNIITLTCEKGCEWKEISIKSSDEDRRVIQSGIKDILKKEPVDLANSEFVFTIERSNGEIKLGNLKGMRWKTLAIKCPENACTQTIDENGVTQLN